MNRITAWSAHLCALVFLASAAGAQVNVLVLVADDLGVDGLASYGVGQDLPATPNLDALAARGIQFQNAWSNPVCSTTRATIMTGRYSFRHGLGTIVNENWALPLSEVTIPEVLDQQGSGYAHAAIGKWHLGNAAVGGDISPNMAGFSHYAGALNNLSSYYQWQYTVNGETAPSQAYPTRQTVSDAIAWIGGTTSPWFCYVAFNAPHAPYHAPPAGTYSVNLEIAGTPQANPRPFYKAMVESMDHEIGRLFQALGPELAQTVVIFLGDNGTPGEVTVAPFLPSHAKGTLYQGGVHVPLIVGGPMVLEKGGSCDSLVNTTDVFASVIDLAGVAPGSAPQTDGISFVPYLSDPGRAPLRARVFSEIFSPNGFGPYLVAGRAIRDARFKLVVLDPDWAPSEVLPAHGPAQPGDLLFDLFADPGERTNLLAGIATFEHTAVYLRLRRALATTVSKSL